VAELRPAGPCAGAGPQPAAPFTAAEPQPAEQPIVARRRAERRTAAQPPAVDTRAALRREAGARAQPVIAAAGRARAEADGRAVEPSHD
jgi:hypothetical protein